MTMRLHVVRAITVRRWTEIVRHHAQALWLRIVERHPSDGDYDTLSLFLQFDDYDFEWEQQLANLNMQAALSADPISAVGNSALLQIDSTGQASGAIATRYPR